MCSHEQRRPCHCDLGDRGGELNNRSGSVSDRKTRSTVILVNKITV